MSRGLPSSGRLVGMLAMFAGMACDGACKPPVFPNKM
jgi:hypothetical protein